LGLPLLHCSWQRNLQATHFNKSSEFFFTIL
jgi:hypothetical protein